MTGTKGTSSELPLNVSPKAAVRAPPANFPSPSLSPVSHPSDRDTPVVTEDAVAPPADGENVPKRISPSQPQPQPYRLLVTVTPESMGHITAFPHQESPVRIAALVGQTLVLPHDDATADGTGNVQCRVPVGRLLRAAWLRDTSSVLWRAAPLDVPAWAHGGGSSLLALTDILRVHSYQYVRHLLSLSHVCRHGKPGEGDEDSIVMHGRDGIGGNDIDKKKKPNGSRFARVEEAHAWHRRDPMARAYATSLQPMAHSSWERAQWAIGVDVDGVPTRGDENGKDRTSTPTASTPPEWMWMVPLDNDTWLSPHSVEAAWAAANAAVEASDAVARGRTQRAFVVARPPGHHAGPHGSVPTRTFHESPADCSCGFCLLNTVAIAAAYVRSQFGRVPRGVDDVAPLRRVAIVDFDIHHGNGTEAIVRSLVPHSETLPLPGSWAPQRQFAYRPWLDETDADETLFCSVHLYNGDFYPGSGGAVDDGARPEPDLFGLHAAPARADPASCPGFPAGWGPSAGLPSSVGYGGILNVPVPPIGPASILERRKLKRAERARLQAQARATWRAAFTHRILPRLDAFCPDFVFISAGFDGHESDFYYFLTEDDFAWATREIVKVADRHAGGRVVSVLEGGYSVDPPPAATGAGKRAHRRRGRGGIAGGSDTESVGGMSVTTRASRRQKGARGKPRRPDGGADDAASVASAGSGAGASDTAGVGQGDGIPDYGSSGLARSVEAHLKALWGQETA